ncbi:unnamed protein product, partial [marine sediment metagenome]
DIKTVSMGETEKVLTVMTMSTDGVETIEGTISEDDYHELELTITELSDFLNENMKEYWQDFKVDESEQEEIAQALEATITKIGEVMPDLPSINIRELLKKLFKISKFPYCLFDASTIISMGVGRSLIPNYYYETFMGVMLRPIFIKYIFGFTSIMHLNIIPPRLEYCNRLGVHRLTTFGFIGFYMSIRDIGVDMPVGLQLILGRAFIVMGPDFP